MDVLGCREAKGIGAERIFFAGDFNLAVPLIDALSGTLEQLTERKEAHAQTRGKRANTEVPGL